jgi:hypothetical protein
MPLAGTVTITHTTLLTTTSAQQMSLMQRQENGQWTPDATFVAPTQVAQATWVGETWPVIPSATAPVWTPAAEPTGEIAYGKTPGEGPDKGKFGATLIIVLVSVLVGIPMLRCFIFWLKNGCSCGFGRRSNQDKVIERQRRLMEAGLPSDFERQTGLTRPSRVVNPGAYPLKYVNRPN